MSDVTLYSVGHSNHSIEHFCRLLSVHDIRVLIDVRSRPFSRFNPQFNRGALQVSLTAIGIRYEFQGDALGARSTDPALHAQGRVSYARLAASAAFKAALQHVLKVASEQRTAIMCAEREPLECHRTILVGREAERAGAKLVHILHDGSLEPNLHALVRLCRRLKLPRDDMFADDARNFDTAYDMQGLRIAAPAKSERAAKK